VVLIGRLLVDWPAVQLGLSWVTVAWLATVALGGAAQAAPPAKPIGPPVPVAEPPAEPDEPAPDAPDPTHRPLIDLAPAATPVVLASTVPPRVAAKDIPDPLDDPAFEFHEDKHYLTALILGGAVIVIPTIYYWSTQESQSVDWTLKWDKDSWKQKLITFDAVRFDTNRFHVNSVRHPGVGILQYQIGRSNGIGMFGSTVLAAGLGAYWEYFVEYREDPSLNDMLMNTIGGISIGEPLYQIGQAWRGGKMSFADRVRSSAFSPFDVVHDLIHHQPNWGRPRYAQRSGFGLGLLATRFDNARIRHEFRVRGDIDVVNHGNFSRPGPRSADIRPGAWSRVAGEMRFGDLNGSTSRVETSFRSQTTIAGHYSQDDEGRGILVAIGTAFTYDRARLAEEWDRLAIGHLAGPQIQLSLRRPGLAVRFDAAGYVDFGQVQAHVFGLGLPFPNPALLLNTLQAQGYYNAWGGSLTSRLRIDSGGWSFDFEAQHHQLYEINGRDRVAPGSLINATTTRADTAYLVPHGAADTRTYWRTAVDYHIQRRAWGVALLLSGSSLTGTWKDLARDSSTITAGLAFTVDLDGVRGVRTPL
jgi:hypothetical protein